MGQTEEVNNNYKRAIETAVRMCKLFEGFSPIPYLCPAGVATIGYGSIYRLDGSRVTMDDPPISEEDATMLMSKELSSCLLSAVTASPVLKDHPLKLAAIIDFIYNLGIGNYRASTLRKRIDAKDWDSAVVEIQRWNRGGGRVLNGLVKRRQAEAMFLKHGDD